MRTTVDLDEDVLATARSLARMSDRPIGAVISELLRRALASSAQLPEGPGGFLTYEAPDGAAPLTVEAVRAAADEP